MQALIFAAGLGTRLRPLTDALPKALAPVCGKPMLAYVIDRLAAAGATKIVVNAHHFADKIVDFVAGYHCPAQLAVVVEPDEPLETGGGLLNARDQFSGTEPIIVHNADILTDFDLQPMAEQHQQRQAMATLLAFRRQSSRSFAFDATGRLVGWTNLSTGQVKPEGLCLDDLNVMPFGGVHIVSPAIFEPLEHFRHQVARSPKFSIVDFYLYAMASNDIYAYTPTSPFLWHDIGTLDKLRQAEQDFLAHEI